MQQQQRQLQMSCAMHAASPGSSVGKGRVASVFCTKLNVSMASFGLIFSVYASATLPI
jgi:hypothetical protein